MWEDEGQQQVTAQEVCMDHDGSLEHLMGLTDDTPISINLMTPTINDK
jgi:hypothetical protein